MIDTCWSGHASLRTYLSTEWICWLEAISFVLGNNNQSVTQNALTGITQTCIGTDQNYHCVALKNSHILKSNFPKPNHNVYREHFLKALCEHVCCWDEFKAGASCCKCNPILFRSVFAGLHWCWRGTRVPCPAAQLRTPGDLGTVHDWLINHTAPTGMSTRAHT